MARQQELRGVDDDLQHVVEVVRDAAGELPDGLHLLGLVDVVLELALGGGLQRVDDGAFAVAILGRGDGREIEPRRAGLVGGQRQVERGDLGAALHRLGQGAVEPAARRDEVMDGGGLRPGRSQAGEGGVGAQDGAVAVDGGDRHRRRVEEAGEADLGLAADVGTGLAGGAVEDERARGAGAAVAAEGDLVVQAHRERRAIAALEIDVEHLDAHIAGMAADGLDERGGGRRRDVVEMQAARAEAGEVEIEPAGEGGVEIGDLAIGVDRDEAGGRMVEIVDRVLQLLEGVLLALALRRDVGDRPERRGPSFAAHRRDLDAVPADGAAPAERRLEPDLLDELAALAGGGGEAVDRLRDLGTAGEEAADRAQIAGAACAGQRQIGLVGIDDRGFALGDDDALVGAVDDRLGQVVAGGAAGELHEPDGEGEEAEDADDREQSEQPQDQRLRPFVGDEAERDGGADEQPRHQQDDADMARLVGTIDRSRGAAHCGVVRPLWRRAGPMATVEASRRVRRGGASGARRIR